jgi:hypothetical protein
MGKKSTFKKLRRLANELPAINIKVVQGESVKGSELYKQGVTEVQGEPVMSARTYSRKKVVEKPHNHYRRMKKLYNQFGPDVISNYVQAVDHIVKSKQKESEEINNQQ